MIAKGEAAPLAAQQRAVLELVKEFYRHNGEAPPARLIARRLALHHRTVQRHLEALYRKGWLKSPDTAGVRCPHPLSA